MKTEKLIAIFTILGALGYALASGIISSGIYKLGMALIDALNF